MNFGAGAILSADCRIVHISAASASAVTVLPCAAAIVQEQGIPAVTVTAFLCRHGIVPSRTTDHMVLFLFSIGITRGKWGTLANTLLGFKRDYDENAPLEKVTPVAVAADPARYACMGLKDLGDE